MPAEVEPELELLGDGELPHGRAREWGGGWRLPVECRGGDVGDLADELDPELDCKEAGRAA